MKALLGFMIATALYVPSFAASATFFICGTSGTSTKVILDFEAGTVEFFSPLRQKVISSEVMTNIQSSDIGGSLRKKHTANVAGEGKSLGVVSLKEEGLNIQGYYQGALTFGDRWDLKCSKTDYNY